MNCAWFTDEYPQIDKHLKVGRRRTQWWKSATKLKDQGLDIPSTVVKSYNCASKRTRPEASGWSVRRGNEKRMHARLGRKTWTQVDALTAHARSCEDPETPMQEEQEDPLTDYDFMMMDIWYSGEGFWSTEEDFSEDADEGARMQHGVPPVGDLLATQMCSVMQCPAEQCFPKIHGKKKRMPEIKDHDEQEPGPSVHVSADNVIRVFSRTLPSHHTMATTPCMCLKPHSLMWHNRKLEASLSKVKQKQAAGSNHVATTPLQPTDHPKSALLELAGRSKVALALAALPPLVLSEIWPNHMISTLTNLMQGKSIVSPWSSASLQLPTVPPFTSLSASIGAPLYVVPRPADYSEPSKCQLCVFDASKFTLTKWVAAKNLPRPVDYSEPSKCQLCVFDASKFALTKWVAAKDLPRPADYSEPSKCQLCVFDASKFALTKWVAAKDLVCSGSSIGASSGGATLEMRTERDNVRVLATAAVPLSSGIPTRRALGKKALMARPKVSPWRMKDVLFSRAKNFDVPKNRSIDFTKIRNHVVATNRIVKAEAKTLKRQAVRTAKRKRAAKLALAAVLSAAKEAMTQSSILGTSSTINRPSRALTVIDVADAKVKNIKENRVTTTRTENTVSLKEPVVNFSKNMERTHGENCVFKGEANIFTCETSRAAPRKQVVKKRALAMTQKMNATTKEINTVPVGTPPVAKTVVTGAPPDPAAMHVTLPCEETCGCDAEIVDSVNRAPKKAHRRRGKGTQSQEKSCKRARLSNGPESASGTTPLDLVWEYEMERQREFWATTSYAKFVNDAKSAKGFISRACERELMNAEECIAGNVKCSLATAEEHDSASAEECGSVNASLCVEEVSLSSSDRICDEISGESGYGSDMVIVEMDELEGVNEDDWVLLEEECA